MPGDLYSFENDAGSEPLVAVNGETVPLDTRNGYVVIEREWAAGDIVELEFPWI